MTEFQQRGYDDTLAGRVDDLLISSDTQAGREYRDGKRRAQWKLDDPAAEPPPVADVVPAETESKAPVFASTEAPGAFSDPPPKRLKKAKQVDDSQLGLFS